MRTSATVAIIVAAIALGGCAATAPNYSTSPGTTQTLQAAHVAPTAVGDFTAAADVDNKSLRLRASSMEPKQGSYSQYLADAIKNELDLAKLYSPSSTTVISGVLLRNELETGVAVKGTGHIEARFVVKRDGQVRFDKVKTGNTEWDSNFIGAIAIPRAQQEYSRLVQTLIGELFADPDFVASLK